MSNLLPNYDNWLQIGNPWDEKPSPSEYWLSQVSDDAYERFAALPVEVKRKIEDYIDRNSSDWTGCSDGWLLNKIEELTE